MASFFKNTAPNQDMNERTLLENKYHTSRHNLLIVIVFTLINLVLLVTGGNSYFLFSAFLPYYMVDLGMYLCGKYPAEFYAFEGANPEFMDITVLYIVLAIAIVVLSVYLLCWILSKKNRVGWLIFALVWFGIDSIMMLLMAGSAIADYIIDIVFHAWVIISLANGIRSYYKLKKLPEEEIEVFAAEQPTEELAEATEE